jgi:anaerobic selenocysteine-containing dehydrogenase
MARLTRRGFLKKTSAGAVAAGALTAAPGLVATTATEEAVELSAGELAGPLVAHVRDVATGEIALMAGTREIVFRDAALVARLLKAAR